jgi:hypothetical protein
MSWQILCIAASTERSRQAQAASLIPSPLSFETVGLTVDILPMDKSRGFLAGLGERLDLKNF